MERGVSRRAHAQWSPDPAAPGGAAQAAGSETPWGNPGIHGSPGLSTREGFGQRGLAVWLPWTPRSALKDCPPLRAVLLGQGQQKATLASMFYEKYSKEMEEEIRPRPRRMESISITHQDYCAMGFQSTPQPLTQVQAVHIPPASLQQPPGRLQGSACPAEHAIPTGSHSASTAASQLLNRAANQLLAGASLWTTRCHCLLQQKHSLQEECRLFHSHYHVLRAS
ncbi:sperm-associated antigen 8 isoform X5 [Vidua chalybeata]|uniref:sperm-associated antigen 8 isoform X5 n=1 Tax=Vidua chalybeata TaxID=81927 RepID=UPI0023A87087|nr:sperm-associated antigen 8 isoform X5 [Vidua chalybeata]